MLRSVKEFEGYPLLASDGKIGHVTDCLFDDRDWTMRYLVADAGSLVPHHVIISPDHLDQPEVGWTGKRFRVNLTKQQVKDSPPLDSDAPLSRRYEIDLAKHYQQVDPYWKSSVFDPEVAEHEKRLEEIAECHLRSANRVRRDQVHATDGEIGHIDDFIVDTSSWKMRYFVVKTRNFLPGGTVLIGIDWIQSIDRTGSKVNVDLTCEKIRKSPEFDVHEPVNRDYEGRLYDYYGKPRYWQEPDGPVF
ncbi:MAG: PRC-barrel domain-containing protein [Verrucomicrobiales bacterium]|nr:PRC-barrel domain-containing protein [Verrucomicrobiales bacterium]